MLADILPHGCPALEKVLSQFLNQGIDFIPAISLCEHRAFMRPEARPAFLAGCAKISPQMADTAMLLIVVRIKHILTVLVCRVNRKHPFQILFASFTTGIAVVPQCP
jgi:hypothetical protein